MGLYYFLNFLSRKFTACIKEWRFFFFLYIDLQHVTLLYFLIMAILVKLLCVCAHARMCVCVLCKSCYLQISWFHICCCANTLTIKQLGEKRFVRLIVPGHRILANTVVKSRQECKAKAEKIRPRQW